jgi:hypothetical protein
VIPWVKNPVGCGSFFNYDGQPLTCVASAASVAATYVDSVARSRNEQAATMREGKRLRRTGFDVSCPPPNGPTLRARV